MQFTLPQVSALTGVGERTLDYWYRTGVAAPAVDLGMGRSRGKRYSFVEVTGIRCIQNLRAQGVSLQRVRRVVDQLRKLSGEGNSLELLSAARLLVLDDGSEVALAETPERLLSLLEAPGQGVFRPVLVAVGHAIAEVQQRMVEVAADDPEMGRFVKELKKQGDWKIGKKAA